MKPVMYVGAAIYAPEDPFATAMLVEDGTIAWMGTHTAAKSLISDAIDVVDVQGALIAPAFVDAHVHLSETGRNLSVLQLDHVGSAHEMLVEVAHYANGLGPAERVLGSGWDETTWEDPTLPTVAELDRATGGRAAYLMRRDLHTALATSNAFAAAGLSSPQGELDGAWMTEEEHHILRSWALSAQDDERRTWQQRGLKGFAQTGHAAVIEMAAPHVSGRRDLELLLEANEELAAVDPEVFALWAELVDSSESARELISSFPQASRHRRLMGLGGDLSLDGSIGAYTAALREPYSDAPEDSGELLLTAEQISAHVVASVQAGLPTGFHAIGDAALDTLLEGYAQAANQVGLRAIRAQRHRIEHAEMLDQSHIQHMLDLGLTASVQPRFDELWGHPGGMYETRLGTQRANAMNPFGALSAAGVSVAFGSDAPVTGSHPWRAIAAAMHHHDPQETMPARAGFLSHTRAGYRSVGASDPTAGTLRWGAAATFAIWEPSELTVGTADQERTSFSTDARARTPMLPNLEADSLPACWATVRDGRTLWDAHGLMPSDDAEAGEA